MEKENIWSKEEKKIPSEMEQHAKVGETRTRRRHVCAIFLACCVNFLHVSSVSVLVQGGKENTIRDGAPRHNWKDAQTAQTRLCYFSSLLC